MYGWAPLAIMGEEINKLSPSSTAAPHAPPFPRARRSTDDHAVEMSSLMADDPLANDGDDPSSSSSIPFKSRNLHTLDLDTDADADDGMAGIYLGIHNIFATIPQFLATFVSMVVFSILEPGQSPELANAAPAAAADQTEGKSVTMTRGGLSGTAVCLAIGAVFQVVAAAQSLRMKRR